MNITKNEMKFVLIIFKSLEIEYNANSISKVLNITPMGALKIAKKIEKQNIISYRELGKAKFFKLNLENEHVKQYIKFLLQWESGEGTPFLKAKISEIRTIKNAYATILFGSVLTKDKEAKDIDILLITDQKMFPKLKKEIGLLNLINPKKYHPIYQSKEDIKKNIKEEDKVIFNAIKGIVVFGEDLIIKLLSK